MIFGIGVDVLEARRIGQTLERFGTRFIDHLLMPEELAQLAKTERRERFLAMRFAAKEAIVKAGGRRWCSPSAATAYAAVSASARAT